jgi:hypothetical protein
MGISLEFIIVGSDDLARVLSEPDYRIPNNAIEKSADFSLHLKPSDLDLLSEAIGNFASRPPQKLRSHLIVLLDIEGRGLMMIENQWVEYVAAARDVDINEIVGEWANRMKISPTPDMNRAVTNLVGLCVAAQRDSVPVLHRWSGFPVP